jgi:hypothetical protein
MAGGNTGEASASPTPTLAAKLAEVMDELGDLAKQGHAEVETKSGARFEYVYITEADLMAKLRPLLAVRNVFPLVSDRVVYREDNLVSVEVTIVFWDGDTGEMSLPITGQGDGTDFGDKALSKAKTTAIRTLLSKTFLQGGGDVDPEQHHVERRSERADVSTQQRPERRVEGPTQAPWGPAKVLDELERMGVQEPKEWLKRVALAEYEVELTNWQDIPAAERQEALERLLGVYVALREQGYDPTGLPTPTEHDVADAFAMQFPKYDEARTQAEARQIEEAELERADDWRDDPEAVAQHEAAVAAEREGGETDAGETGTDSRTEEDG